MSWYTETFDKVRGKVAGVAAPAAMLMSATAATLTGTANQAIAQDASVQSAAITTASVASELQAGELLKAAGEYSRSGQGVGVAALIGDDFVGQGFSPEQVAEVIEARIGNFGAPSEVFFAYNGDKGTSIILLTKNNSYGPLGAEEALSKIEVAANEFLDEQVVANLDLDAN